MGEFVPIDCVCACCYVFVCVGEYSWLGGCVGVGVLISVCVLLYECMYNF